jgi:hypothetical protein
MSVLKYFNQDPDEFIGSFAPVTVRYPSRNGKVLIELGLVKENNRLCFIIGKRFTREGSLLILDQVRLSLASQKTFGNRPKRWSDHAFYRQEFIRQAFEDFVNESPFAVFIRANINPLAATLLSAKLRDEGPKLISFTSGAAS